MTAVPILLWHAVGDGAEPDPFRVTPDAFARHLDLVRESARRTLTADQYADVLGGRAGGPQDCALLTFDDGFADLVSVVLPELAERGLQATAFVTSGYLGRPGMLDAGSLRELADAGPVEIGAHSVSHPHLDVVSRRRAEDEIQDSRKALEDLLGRPVTSFAYPHGSHSRRTRSLVVDAGYRTAQAVKNAISHPNDDPYSVGRFTVRAGTDVDEVRRVLDGHGAPLSWRGDRVRTQMYRHVRRGRRLMQAVDG